MKDQITKSAQSDSFAAHILNAATMKHCIILGTRPEIIKLSPIVRELQKRSRAFFLLHTNQHYSRELDKIFFCELGLPVAKFNLAIGSGPHGAQTGRMLMAIEGILQQEKPTHVYVQGDTNTALAGVLAAAKELGIRIAHIEAGLRSYDRSMPEEINRVIADHLSDFLFAPTEAQQKILRQEGIPQDRIFVVGNTVVDAIEQNKLLCESRSTILEDLGLAPKRYVVFTIHRPANVDDQSTLTAILTAMKKIGEQQEMPIVFPCHPRTRKRIEDFHLTLKPGIRAIEPIGYLDMIKLMLHARLIATDSGGLQEEACILHVPCITLRQNTERPETLLVGGNMLAGQATESIMVAAGKMLQKNLAWTNPFGDGHAAGKIIDIIESH